MEILDMKNILEMKTAPNITSKMDMNQLKDQNEWSFRKKQERKKDKQEI